MVIRLCRIQIADIIRLPVLIRHSTLLLLKTTSWRLKKVNKQLLKTFKPILNHVQLMGCGKVVKDNLDLQMTVWGRPIDINKMFSPASQGGCFADIGKIIDLSVTIPSLDTDHQCSATNGCRLRD